MDGDVSGLTFLHIIRNLWHDTVGVGNQQLLGTLGFQGKETPENIILNFVRHFYIFYSSYVFLFMTRQPLVWQDLSLSRLHDHTLGMTPLVK